MFAVIILGVVAAVIFILYKLITRNDIVCHSICAAIALVGIILCYTVAKNNQIDMIIMAGIVAFIWSVFTFNGTDSEVTITEFMGGWYEVVEESAFSVKCTIVFCSVVIACLVTWLAFPWGAGVILGIMLAFNALILGIGTLTYFK